MYESPVLGSNGCPANHSLLSAAAGGLLRRSPYGRYLSFQTRLPEPSVAMTGVPEMSLWKYVIVWLSARQS